MKKFLETHWQQPEPDSRGRFGPTGFEHQLVDQERQRPVVKVAMVEVIAVIYRLLALAQRPPLLVVGTITAGVHPP